MRVYNFTYKIQVVAVLTGLLLLFSSCKVSGKYFGTYQGETPYSIIELKSDSTFTSVREVHGMRFINSGTFSVLRDTVLLSYKNGVIDSAGGPPPKSFWKRRKLYYVNGLTGEMASSAYACKIK